MLRGRSNAAGLAASPHFSHAALPLVYSNPISRYQYMKLLAHRRGLASVKWARTCPAFYPCHSGRIHLVTCLGSVMQLRCLHASRCIGLPDRLVCDFIWFLPAEPDIVTHGAHKTVNQNQREGVRTRVPPHLTVIDFKKIYPVQAGTTYAHFSLLSDSGKQLMQ